MDDEKIVIYGCGCACCCYLILLIIILISGILSWLEPVSIKFLKIFIGLAPLWPNI